MHRFTDLLILGGGNMGGAIALACARAGLRVHVVEPNAPTRDALAARANAANAPSAASAPHTTASFASISVAPDLTSGLASAAASLRAQTACIVLAVKPQVFPTVAPDLANALAGTTPVVLSIMAGVTTGSIEAALPGTRVLRAMPNLGAAINRSTTALCAGATANAADETAVAEFIQHFGTVEPIDESLMDAFTVLAGSGPAFLFYLAEAMARGGTAAGFDHAQSRRIVAHTLDAAARLLANPEPQSTSPSEPHFDAAALRARVTSKKGTTQAAMELLDAEDVMGAIARAVIAGRDRGRELGGSKKGPSA